MVAAIQRGSSCDTACQLDARFLTALRDKPPLSGPEQARVSDSV